MTEMKITLVTEYKEGAELIKKRVDVWGKKLSLNRTEFYAAYSAGLKPKYVIRVYTADFHLGDVVKDGVTYEPTRLVVNGSEVAIIRTYDMNETFTELTVG